MTVPQCSYRQRLLKLKAKLAARYAASHALAPKRETTGRRGTDNPRQLSLTSIRNGASPTQEITASPAINPSVEGSID